MIEANAIFAEAPAEINGLAMNAGGKIEQADVQIFDDTAGGMNAIERGLQSGGDAIALEARIGGAFVRNDYAALADDAFGESHDFGFEIGHFLAGLHGFDEHGLEFARERARLQGG